MTTKRRTAVRRKTVDFTASGGNCFYPLGTLNWPNLPAGNYRMTMTVRRLKGKK